MVLDGSVEPGDKVSVDVEGEGLGLGAGLESREAMREAAYASTAGEERLLQEARR
jgi:hypothetical protein